MVFPERAPGKRAGHGHEKVSPKAFLPARHRETQRAIGKNKPGSCERTGEEWTVFPTPWCSMSPFDPQIPGFLRARAGRAPRAETIPPIRRCTRRSAPCSDFGCHRCLDKPTWSEAALFAERERQGPDTSWSPSSSEQYEDGDGDEDSLDYRRELEHQVQDTVHEISPTQIVDVILKF